MIYKIFSSYVSSGRGRDKTGALIKGQVSMQVPKRVVDVVNDIKERINSYEDSPDGDTAFIISADTGNLDMFAKVVRMLLEQGYRIWNEDMKIESRIGKTSEYAVIVMTAELAWRPTPTEDSEPAVAPKPE